jgi:hypothetical protein
MPGNVNEAGLGGNVETGLRSFPVDRRNAGADQVQPVRIIISRVAKLLAIACRKIVKSNESVRRRTSPR